VRHILHLEEHVMFLDRWKKAPRNLIGTLHLPPDAWSPGEIEDLKRLSSGIVLYRRDVEFFEALLGKERVKVILHGVDIDFFHPNAGTPPATNILYTGHYLRNTPMLARVIARLAQSHPELRFHLLVPAGFRGRDGFAELQDRPEVTWHHGLSDEELRALIAGSYVVLLPMNESGANTAVVEALACATPVVTTDVGGIRDYGGGTIYPVVRNNDDDAMIALIEQYLAQPGWRNRIAQQCREFAVRTLAWPLIARQHLEAYEALAA
jgi:glycosyltransferase involved in cell wall biosynthesis